MKASIVSRGLEQWQDDVLSLIFSIDQPFVFSDWFPRRRNFENRAHAFRNATMTKTAFVQLEILPKKTAN